MVTAPARLQPQQWVQLSGISWETYQRLQDEQDNRNLRLSYYKGYLDIMAPSPEHEYFKKVMGRLVETLAEELVVDLYPLGSMTLDREDLDSGSQPDECFYLSVQKIQIIKGKKRIDFAQDPAPDLVLEIDITHRSKHRNQVYQALQVPEFWQFDGQRLRMLALQNGEYKAVQYSLAFPKVSAQDIESFLLRAETQDYLQLIRDFRQWLGSQ